MPLALLTAITGISLLIYFPSKIVSSRAIPIAIWMIVLSAAINRSTKSKLKLFGLISNFLNQAFLQNLGKISYSVYLIHLLIIYPLLWLIMTAFPDANKIVVLLVLLLFGITITTIVSFALYEIVEKPCISFGKKLSKHI